MDAESGARAAVAVAAEALGIADDAADLAATLTLVSDEAPVLVWTLELEANGEPVAFLVYGYDLGRPDADGASGADRMAGDLAVMAEAAARGAPGPRLVAQGEAGDWGVAIATSPAVLERLSPAEARAGQDPAGSGPAKPPKVRAQAATALLAALRDAERRSAAFLRAVGDGRDAATPEERALALFVADGRSLASLPRALAVAVERGTAAARPKSSTDPT